MIFPEDKGAGFYALFTRKRFTRKCKKLGRKKKKICVYTETWKSQVERNKADKLHPSV